MDVSLHRVTSVTKSVEHFDAEGARPAFDLLCFVATSASGEAVTVKFFMDDGVEPKVTK